MTRNEVIEIVANDPEYNRACRKIAVNSSLAEDLYQELMLILLEYSEEKLIKIYEEKRIKWFIISILLKMCHSTTSPFYKNIRKFSSITEEISGRENEIEDECHHSPCIDEIIDIVDATEDEILQTENGYEKMLLKLSVELGSVQKVSKALDIPYLSVWISLNNYKKKIKSQYGKV